MPRNKIFRSIYEISILAFILSIGLPASIAFFTQRGNLKAKYAEPEFKNSVLENGKKPYIYYFNRGL